VQFPDFQPMRVSEEPVCIYLCRQNPIFTSLHLRSPVHVVPPQKWMYIMYCSSSASLRIPAEKDLLRYSRLIRIRFVSAYPCGRGKNQPKRIRFEMFFRYRYVCLCSNQSAPGLCSKSAERGLCSY
jgi:hypothetical protein